MQSADVDPIRARSAGGYALWKDYLAGHRRIEG